MIRPVAALSPDLQTRFLMKPRLVTSLFVLALLLLAGFVHIGMSWYVEGQLARDAQARLSLLSDTFRTSIDRVSGLPALAGATVDVRTLLQRPDDETARAAANVLLQRMTRENGLDAVFVLDFRGVTLASSNFAETGSYIGGNYSFRPYFRIAKETGSGSYYGVGVTTGRPGYFLSSRIQFGPGPQDFGVIVVKTVFSRLEASWADGGERVLVSDADGVVFLSSTSSLRYRPLAELSPQVRALLDAEHRYATNPIGATIDLRREFPPSVISSREIDGTSWKITTVLLRSSRDWQPPTAALTVFLVGLVTLLTIVTLKQQSDRHKADRRTKRDLEIRVAERTSELVSAMSLLEAEIIERRNADAALHKARDELVQAAKLASMGQAFAGLAHEVNQPLAALKTYLSSTRLLLSRGDTDSAVANIGIMDETVERLARLTGSLKHLSRRSDHRREEIDLAETARRMIELMKFRIRDAGTTVGGAYDAPVLVDADPARIEQIILNLLKNAIYAAKRSVRPEIVVIADIRDGYAHLGVGDYGAGVPETARARLFEPFFTTKEVGEGLGLGLAISYAIAQEHGGALRYERTAEGQTWFHLYLPVKTTIVAQEQHT